MAKGKAATASNDEAEDHVAEFDKRVETLTKLAEDAEFSSGSLLGDVRDAILESFKHRPKPWSQMSEQEQRDMAKAAENVARILVRKIVVVVAEEDLVSVQATLKGYSADGEVFKLKAEARGDEETALDLFRMDGHDVVIMSADANRFLGQKKDADVQPDQPALGFSDGEEGGVFADGEDVDLAEAGNAENDETDGAAMADEAKVEEATTD